MLCVVGAFCCPESGVSLVIWTYGGPTPQAGYSTDLGISYLNKKKKLCELPYQISRGDVAGRWTIVETFDRNFRGPAPNVAAVVAHELGHDLLLAHGDGQDNDQNGTWDDYCDLGETHAGSSLMDSIVGQSTTITPLQNAKPEAAAALVP